MKLGSILKRDAILFKRGVLSALVLALLFLGLCAGAASAFSAAEGGEGALRVLLVDEDNSLLSRIAVSAVREQKYMESALLIEKSGLDDAMNQIESGECTAVIILPSGYIESIMSGRDCRGKILLSASASLHADVVEKVARAGEILIAAGQNGVFCGESLIWSHGIVDEVYDDYITESNVALMEEAVGAYEKYFTVETLDYADTHMSLTSYYALCWSVIALGLCTLLFRELYFSDFALLPRLMSAGVKEWQYAAGKILYPALFRMVMILAAAAWIGNASGLTLSAGSIGGALAAILLSSLVGAAAMFRFGSRGSVTVLILDSIGLFLSGGIIPRTMLPDTLTMIADILPSGAVRGLLSPLFGGTLMLWSAVFAAIYFALSVWLIRSGICRRLKGGEAE